MVEPHPNRRIERYIESGNVEAQGRKLMSCSYVKTSVNEMATGSWLVVYWAPAANQE